MQFCRGLFLDWIIDALLLDEPALRNHPTYLLNI